MTSSSLDVRENRVELARGMEKEVFHGFVFLFMVCENEVIDGKKNTSD